MEINIKVREKDFLVAVSCKNGTMDFEFDSWSDVLVYLCSVKDPELIKKQF